MKVFQRKFWSNTLRIFKRRPERKSANVRKKRYVSWCCAYILGICCLPIDNCFNNIILALKSFYHSLTSSYLYEAHYFFPVLFVHERSIVHNVLIIFCFDKPYWFVSSFLPKIIAYTSLQFLTSFRLEKRKREKRKRSERRKRGKRRRRRRRKNVKKRRERNDLRRMILIVRMLMQLTVMLIKRIGEGKKIERESIGNGIKVLQTKWGLIRMRKRILRSADIVVTAKNQEKYISSL